MDFSAPDYQAYLSFLSPYVHPFLEQLLDWDHGGVDVDLNEIADHMLDWEDRLSAHLGLTHIDISHIKEIHLHQPPLQRRDALKRWRNRCGLRATYGNLLKLFVEAGHTECAQVICDILNRKVSFPPTSSEGMEDQVARHKDVREFSEDLSSGDLYGYLLLKHVPKRDCDIIKEREISGVSFLELSIKYWEICGISEPGVIAIVKLQEKIKAAQATIIPNLSPHVPDKPCDLKNVMIVLKDLSPLKYLDLGLELGIEKSDIEKLEESHPNNPRRVLVEIIDQWLRNNPDHSWDALRAALEAIDEKSFQIYEKKYEDYLDAYRKILATGDSLEMLFVKIAFLGPPRLGKTTARRRLTGEIVDISSAAEPEQPSTGAVESGGNVVVRSISNTTALMTPSEWSIVKDLTEEAHMLLQFIYNRNMELNQSHVPLSETSSKEIHTADKDEKFSSSGEKEKEHSDKVVGEVSNPQISSDEDSTSSSLKGQRGSDKPHGITEIPKLFRNAAVNPKLWKDIKLLFRDSALLKMEDTGGQPEFMDMLPALTIGPALYLLFCKLIDDLLSRYTVSYVSPSSGESTTPVESTYTVEEVLLTALASVSCFSSYSAMSEVSVEEAHSSEVKEILNSFKSFKSVAYIVGTYKDLVSEEQIEEFDQQLQHSIRSTDFFREDLVQFSSEKKMILAIDNMNGGVKEIEKVRKFLERGIHQHFKKLRIPASWLVFSLCLRARTERIASLNDCYQLAQQLNMPSKETKIALWFLHHYAGVLMYFPDLPELENTVICDTQIIYDSVTNLIINTFKFGSVSKWASERFRETGQFSLEDIRRATSNVSGDYIPLIQLLKLLEHLNIIAIVKDDSHPSQTKPIQSSKVIYFMPCVLQNATSEELDIYSSCNPCLPASLMIRYKCGFVPLGIFPVVIANLVGHSPLTLIEYNIKKNHVQFYYGTTDYDKVTLIYRTKYFEIHIRRERNVVTPTHEVCRAVREILESTLKAVSSRMNYAFSLCYQLSFECPSHPGEDHLCVVDNTEGIPHKMKCLKNGKNPQPVDMQSQHLVWFGKALTGSDGCTSASNLQPKGDSNLTTLNIKTILVDEDFSANKAEELGIFLGIKKGRISTLRMNNIGNADQVLTAIIEEWLRNDKKKSWEKLADAVRRCHYPLLADKILKQYCEEVFQKQQQQQQQSSILMTPVEKMEQTRESNIIYKRTVLSNGSDKEEVLPGKDFTAENNKGLSRADDVLSPDSTDVKEFSEDLNSGDLYRYLLFKNVSKRDCDIIKEEEISGLCFLGLLQEDWKDFGLSRAGVVCVTRLQEMVKVAQIKASTSPHVSGPPSLMTLMKLLTPVRHRWQEISIQLGVSNNKLRDFKKFDDPFTKSLDYWVNGNTDVPITWGSVVAALESPHVGEYLFAKTLNIEVCEQIYEKTDGAPSLKTLLNELVPVRHIWRKISIQLGIPSNHLHVFEKSDDDPFTGSLDFWLNGNTNVPVTWGSVVAALESPHVGEYVFAKRLREKWSTSKESEQIYEKTDGCPSLRTLLNELAPLRHIWRKISIQLGISSNHLHVFEKSDDDPFTESLDFWLNGNTDVPVTWGSVIAALESPHVGEYVLAKRLREKWSTSKESEQIYVKTDGVPTLRTLLNELAPVKHKWLKICIQLGISNSELSEFNKIRDDPLIEGLDCWLNGNTDVPITWGSVVAVLESPHVGEYVFAKRLREKWSTSKESEQIYEKTDGVPTLRTLLNELAPVKHKWHKICIQLGISNSELSEFKKIRDDPLIEGLDYWLNGNTDVPITWGSVVAVLESPDVRENLLAEKLRKKWTTSKESEQQVYEKKDGAPSLKALLNELTPVRQMWREICIQLNISNKKLHDFEKFDDPFTDCLDYWLNGNTDVPITWGSVVIALESPHVNCNFLAERLREKWITIKESEQIYVKTDGAPSLKTLLNELAPVRHMWREICIQLNISNKKLQDFEKFDDPFTECLDYWLDGNTDVPITWGSVVAALESPDVNYNFLAQRLREKWTTSKESEQIYEKTDGGLSRTHDAPLPHSDVPRLKLSKLSPAADSAGETIELALLVASLNGQVEEAKSLLERGAQINFQAINDGASALHIASQNCHLEVAKLLLEKGAKVDLLDSYQRSPLMIACEHELTYIAQVLLDYDADTYLRNKNGQTALDIAKEKNHVNIISLFAELKEKAAYPGILFSEGMKKEFITSDGKTINLEDVGISITFPKNSLPSTDPPLEVTIQPCFSGPFEMPDGIESVSPAYIIKYNRKIRFLKDVILKIQHYANLQTEEDCKNIVFFSARCTPQYRGSSPVYVFKEITASKGLFGPRQKKPFGEIQTRHFSIITAGINSGTGGKLYSARLFKTEKPTVFCMCLYQSQYMQHCEKVIASKYTGTQKPIEYNCVTLSSNEVAIRASENNEWRVTFHKTKIFRTEIEIQERYQDNFKELLELNYPPRIDISVTLTPVTQNPKPLELLVEGLNEEDCIFNLDPDHYDISKISPQVLPHSSVTTQGLSRTHDAPSLDGDAPRPKLPKLSPAADSAGTGSSSLTLANIRKFLADGDFPSDKAEELATYLFPKPGKISALRMNSYGNADRLLSNVITEWLNNDSEKSWHKLADALRYCSHSVMADKMLQVRKRAVTKAEDTLETSSQEETSQELSQHNKSVVFASINENKDQLERHFIARKPEDHREGIYLPLSSLYVILVGVIVIVIIWILYKTFS